VVAKKIPTKFRLQSFRKGLCRVIRDSLAGLLLSKPFTSRFRFGIRLQYRSSTSRKAAVPRASGPSSTSGTGQANS